MKENDFSASKSGRVIRTPQDYLAFVPNPLPPEIPFDMSLALALSKADSALSELSGLGGQLPNPHLLISPYIRREAVLSSRIEGTKASLSDLLIDEIDDGNPRRRKTTTSRVRNYIRDGARYRLLASLPLSPA
jgi:Fic family protein